MEGFIVWTEREGGEYHAWRGTREIYDRAVEQGYLTDDLGQLSFAYIAWAPIVADFDVILGRPRHEEATV
jgi:hypothetical protein